MKISVKDLSFAFGEKVIFKNFSLDISSGDDALPTVILGPSGCGKTTLLRLIAGLEKPDEGEIIFEEEGRALREDKLPSVSFVFQEPRLLPHLNILQNTALPLEKIYGKDEARNLAHSSLRSVSLDENASAFPSELSGGQRQRASIARAFAYPCKTLLMDEPFQSLDIPLCYSLMDLTLTLLKEGTFPGNARRLALVVTHSPKEAIYMGSRVIVLGKLQGDPHQPPCGIILDEKIDLSAEERAGGINAGGLHPAAELETRLLEARLLNALRVLFNATTNSNAKPYW